MKVKTLERCFYEKVDRDMSNIVHTVEDRIKNAFLTAIVSIVAAETELVIGLMNASSGRDATSNTINSERGEHLGINALFENASGKNNVLHVSNMNDETRRSLPVKVGELSVAETRFDRQTLTHHNHGFHISTFP